MLASRETQVGQIFNELGSLCHFTWLCTIGKRNCFFFLQRFQTILQRAIAGINCDVQKWCSQRQLWKVMNQTLYLNIILFLNGNLIIFDWSEMKLNAEWLVSDLYCISFKLILGKFNHMQYYTPKSLIFLDMRRNLRQTVKLTFL